MKKFLFLLAVLPLTARAVDTDSLALAMARSNPDVAAAHAQIAATDYSGRATNVLAGPEAEFEWKRGGGESRWGVSVGQSFDWPGVYSARRQATEARTDAARQLYAAAVQEKWLEAKTAIMQYAAAGVQVAYLRRAVDNFKHLGEVYGRALERGETTILEVRKTELQLAAGESALARAEVERSAAYQTLAAISPDAATRALAAGIDMPSAQAPEAYATYADAYAMANPDISAARSLKTAAAYEATAARRAALPSFKLSYIHDFEENTHFNGFGVSVGLPSWGPSASRRAAEAEAVVAAESLTSKMLAADAALRADYERVTTLYAQLEPLQRVFGTANDYPALLGRALEAGRITLFEYLTEYNIYLDGAADYASLLADYATALARLQRYVVFSDMTND